MVERVCKYREKELREINAIVALIFMVDLATIEVLQVAALIGKEKSLVITEVKSK